MLGRLWETPARRDVCADDDARRNDFEAPWNAYFTGTITKLPATNAGVWEVTFSDGSKLEYDTEHGAAQG
jgi:hypothetical protein